MGLMDGLVNLRLHFLNAFQASTQVIQIVRQKLIKVRQHDQIPITFKHMRPLIKAFLTYAINFVLGTKFRTKSKSEKPFKIFKLQG